MGKRKYRFIRRYFGYLLLAVAVVLLFGTRMGPLTLAALFVVCFFWMLFAAPTWCGAETREGKPCRNNSYGLLVGCSYRQHRWQRLSALTHLDTVGTVVRSWFKGAQQQVATCSMIAAAVGAVASILK